MECAKLALKEVLHQQMEDCACNQYNNLFYQILDL